VPQIRTIADEVGAKVLLDAALQCGMIAGGTFPNPLAQI
jgi:glycine hydroxymethyltransferase